MDNEWLDDMVEAYVDGDLSREERRRFESALADSAELQASVATARRVKDGLASLEETCPESAVSGVLALAAKARTNRPLRDRYLESLGAPGTTWIRAFAVAAILFAIALTSVLVARRPAHEREVERGLADVKLALAYVGMAGRETGDILRTEVDQGVIQPIERAIGRTGRDSIDEPAPDKTKASPNEDKPVSKHE